ncbi:hypothetical protein BH09BAC2_BH09BAC2_18570 [soil metagenome]
MKKLFFLLMLLPFLGFSQMKNVVNANRIFAAPGKDAALRKALTAHAQKYHKGAWSWRVYSIESGPDAGGYHIVEGPNTWDELDSRGDLGAAHTADWDNAISGLLSDRGGSGYSEYDSDLSTSPLTEFSQKAVLFHIYPKPGKFGAAMNMVKGMKTTWATGTEAVAVFTSASSGAPSITLVYRMKAGFKEMADNFRKPTKERYETLNGTGSYDRYLQSFADNIESRWEEIIVYHPEWSSK